MQITNLTPHALNIVLLSGEIQTIAPSGNIARCSTTAVVVGECNGIPLSTVSYGNVVGLPEPEAGTLYVVSALVRSAVPGREDVASPGDLVRDPAGAVIGCKGLVVNP